MQKHLQDWMNKKVRASSNGSIVQFFAIQRIMGSSFAMQCSHSLSLKLYLMKNFLQTLRYSLITLFSANEIYGRLLLKQLSAPLLAISTQTFSNHMLNGL